LAREKTRVFTDFFQNAPGREKMSIIAVGKGRITTSRYFVWWVAKARIKTFSVLTLAQSLGEIRGFVLLRRGGESRGDISPLADNSGTP
jgi:ABC-type phosphate transport system permease subunit